MVSNRSKRSNRGRPIATEEELHAKRAKTYREIMAIQSQGQLPVKKQSCCSQYKGLILATICSLGTAAVIVLILILLGVIGPNSKDTVNKYEGQCPESIKTCSETDGQDCPDIFYVEEEEATKSCKTCQKLFPGCEECTISSEDKSIFELLDV